MRRRLVQSTLAVAVVAVALLGVPLSVAGVLVQGAYARESAARAALAVGQTVDRRIDAGEQVTESVLWRVPDGAYGVVRVDDTQLSVGTAQARPIRGEYHSARTYVLVELSGADLLAAQMRMVLLVLGASVVAMAAAVAVGLVQARRLAEPLDDLARRARRLGGGDTRPSFPRYGLPEVDEVAGALDSSASRVATTLASERQFASDASHQLRTPLTALSMRLEEILNTGDVAVVREEARIAQTQVERLSAVVDQLLVSARKTRSAGVVVVDVDEVIAQQLAEWAPAFAAEHRTPCRVGTRRLRALATPGGFAQVLATLLENSLLHGAGRVLVSTRTTGTSVVVEVSDQGPGIPPELAPRVFERAVSGRSSTGLGLALARDLAEADGGRLELVRARPATFALFLAVATGQQQGAPTSGPAPGRALRRRIAVPERPAGEQAEARVRQGTEPEAKAGSSTAAGNTQRR